MQFGRKFRQDATGERRSTPLFSLHLKNLTDRIFLLILHEYHMH